MRCRVDGAAAGQEAVLYALQPSLEPSAARSSGTGDGTHACAAPQMQRQVDELEAEADQIADVSGEASAEYHRLRQVRDCTAQLLRS